MKQTQNLHRFFTSKDGRCHFFLLVILSVFFLVPDDVRAFPILTCTPNISPSSNCSNLQLSTPSLNIAVPVGMTVGQGANDSVTIMNTAENTIFTNNGTVTSPNNDGISNFGHIATIDNYGVIQGGVDSSAINNQDVGVIASLVNRNQISMSDFGLASINNAGLIGALTNVGTIYGVIRNNDSGTISTINNLQGKTALTSSPLELDGNVPAKYNIIITGSSNYGKLSLTGASGSMAFGIYAGGVTGVPASVVTATTYTEVVKCLPSPCSGMTLTGTGSYAGGYLYSLVFHPSLILNGVDTWDLVITLDPNYGAGGSSGAAGSTSTPTSMTSGSTTLSSIGVTATPVFAGGTLVLSAGERSGQAFIVTSAGGTITSPSSGAAQLSGVISGVGGLTMNGTGTLVLSGLNTYAGGTTIASGTLSLLGGSLGTGNVFVAAGAELAGTGTIAGPISVAGMLKPGNSPGYLAASSTITMQSGSTYLQDIAGLTQSSLSTPVGATGYYAYLTVSGGGQFVIESSTTLTPRLSNLFSPIESGYGSTPYIPVLGDRFRILTADGGIAGRFSVLTQPAELTAGTQFIAFYNLAGSNSLELSVIPVSYATALTASNANTRSVASVLDKVVVANQAGLATSAQDQLLYVAAAQRASSLPSFVQGLAGEVYAATVAVVSQASLRIQQAVMSRLSDIVSYPVFAGAMNPNATITKATPNNGSAWGEIAYQRGNRSGDDQGSGFSSSLYQLVLGADAYSEHGIKLGGGLALSNTNVSANQGTGTVQQGSLFLYGKLPVDTFVLDGMASFGLNSTNTSRNDVTGYASGFSHKNIKGNDALVSLGLSRPIELDDFRLTPYARATWQMVNQSSFNEGASPAALSVDQFNGNGVRGVIGMAIGSRTASPLKEKFTYKVNVGVGLDSSNLINPALNATLAGMPVTITTPRAGSAFVQAGFYGTVKIADNAFAYAGVAGEFRNGSSLGNVNLGVTIQF